MAHHKKLELNSDCGVNGVLRWLIYQILQMKKSQSSSLTPLFRDYGMIWQFIVANKFINWTIPVTCDQNFIDQLEPWNCGNTKRTLPFFTNRIYTFGIRAINLFVKTNCLTGMLNLNVEPACLTRMLNPVVKPCC